jgi:ABC-type uncharacterized transport system YnjBCD permease subunit
MESKVKASAMLFKELVYFCGGTSAIANSLGEYRQKVNVWLNRGFAPVDRVYELSKLLGVSPWALSYYKISTMLGPELSPTFKEIVGALPLPLPTKEELLDTYYAET